MISIAVLGLTTRYLFAPFAYNRLEDAEWGTFIEIDNNNAEIDDSIQIKSGRAGYTISNQRSSEMMVEIETLIDKENKMVSLQELRLKPKWWKELLPSNFKKYEDKKREAIGYLRQAHDNFAKEKRIEYAVQRILQELDDYDKQITYDASDKDWPAYVNRAREATVKGKNIASESANMVRDGIITKQFYNYIQQTVSVKNEMTQVFLNPNGVTSTKAFQANLDDISTKYGARIDYLTVMEEWRKEIVDPIGKNKDSDYATFLQRMAEAQKLSNDNHLYPDFITKTIHWFNKNSFSQSR